MSRPSTPSDFLLKKPSLPSLLSSRHITRRTHASDDASTLKSEIFTPQPDTEQDYFGDSVTVDAYHASEGKGKEKAEEDPRERLLATLQRSKIARQTSTSSITGKRMSGYALLLQYLGDSVDMQSNLSPTLRNHTSSQKSSPSLPR